VSAFCFHNIEADPSFQTTSPTWLKMHVPSWTERIAIYDGSRFIALVVKTRDHGYYIQTRLGEVLTFADRRQCANYIFSQWGLCPQSQR